MKTLIKLVALTAIAIACISCNKENSLPEEVEYVYAKFYFSGDISIQPLSTKSDGTAESFEEGDLLLVNVTQFRDDSFNWPQGQTSIRCGVFTNVNDIVIPLIKGGHYQIIAFVIKGVASSATWIDLPSTRNQLIEDKVVQLFSMALNGKSVNHYKSYRGGQRITANSNIDLNLKMVKNYFGITLNHNDVKGDVMVFSNIARHDPHSIDSYATVASGQTTLMRFSEMVNTGTSDNGRCETFEEQCITTGDGAMYDPEYLRGFDIRIARKLDGEVSYLNIINVEVKAGDNVIINIEEADFTGYSGELSLDFSEDTGMNDIYYN